MALNQSEGELGDFEDIDVLAGGEPEYAQDAQGVQEGVLGVRGVQDEEVDGDMGVPPAPRALKRTGSNNQADEEDDVEATRRLMEEEAAAAGELMRKALVPEAAAKLEQEADTLAGQSSGK